MEVLVLLSSFEQPKHMRDFLTYLEVIKGKSKNTITSYEFDLCIFFRFLKIERGLIDKKTSFKDIKINDCDTTFIKEINLSELYSFVKFSQNVRKNSNKTKARKIACLKSFFNYLHKRAKIIDEDISVDLEFPSITKSAPLYLTLDESKRLIGNVDAKAENYYRDYCIFILFLNCGLRMSELLSINIDDIKGDTINVLGKGDKERTVYLPPSCIRAIEDYLKIRVNIKNIEDEDSKKALFVSKKKNRLNRRSVHDIVKKYSLKTGLDRKISAHKLRHTAATNLYKYGEVDIRTLQYILGHESVATTQIYTHLDNEDIRKAVNKNPLGDI